MTSAISFVKNAKNIFHSSANKSKQALSAASSPVTDIGERLAGCSNIPPKTELLQQTENAENILNNVLNRIKCFCKKLRPKEKLPLYYNQQEAEKTVNSTLETYLKFFKPPKGQSAEKFRAKIQKKLSRFYIEEAKKAEEILTKNKTVFEELDNGYQESLNKLMQEAKASNLPKEECLKVIMKKKVEIDQEFGNKILDIFAKEYGLEEFKPILECREELSGTANGGWNPIFGKITLDSNRLTSSKSFVGTLFHEYTHYRQDVELFKSVGQERFMKYTIASVVLKDKNMTHKKLLTLMSFKEIAFNPMYKKLDAYTEKHKKTTHGINKNLIRIRALENMHYKDPSICSFKEYSDQLCELHARHNGNYFKELYSHTFPNYASYKKAK